MAHYLPVDEIQKELQEAVEEFRAAEEGLRQEEYQLEADLVHALEKQKIKELKNKLVV